MTALADLPPLYAHWLDDLLGPVAGEPLSTCNDCAMCAKPDGTLPTSVYAPFQRDIKCCVYLPELPNFLVGAVLADETSEGRESVRARVAAKVAVTPLGVGRPPSYDLPFRNAVNVIGRSRALRCPHFVEDAETGGRCGIWRHRDAMCTTWFCRHERGRTGFLFWSAVRELLAAVEVSLAREAALALGIDAEILAGLLRASPRTDGDSVDGAPDPLHDARFGPWAGREEAFYRACAERVAGLSWSDVLARSGPDVAILAAAARRGHGRREDRSVPARLRVGRFDVFHARTGGVRAVTHSSLDAIDLPAGLLAVLDAFDGRETSAILADLAARGVGVDAGYLRQLVDWGVLEPA